MSNMFSFFVVVLFCLAGLSHGNEGEIAYYKTPQQIHLSYTNDPTSMSVAWFTKDPSDLLGGVWYGTSPTNISSFSSSKVISLSDGSGYYNTAVMTGLNSGRVYHYFVGSRHEFFSDIFTFKVPNPTDRVKILAFGDMGTFPRGDTTLMHSVRVHEVNPTEPHSYPSVVLQAGDLMYPFGNLGMIASWFDAMEKVGARVPFMVAPGNRDQQDLISERFDMPMTTVGDHPEPARHNFYYSFDVNFVHFVVISTNFDNFRSGSAQYKWLKKDIANAQKQVEDPSSSLSWIVLMGHTPMYSSSDGHTQGNHELKLAIEELIEPVTLCLWGDDHVYERSHPIHLSHPDISENINVYNQRPTKPIHITVGTGGIDNDGWAVDQPEWSANRFITKGYLSMEVKKSSFSVVFIDRDSREVRDYFDIRESGGLNSHPLLLAGAFLLLVGLIGFFLKGRKSKSVLGV